MLERRFYYLLWHLGSYQLKLLLCFCMSHTETFITDMYRHDVTKLTLITVLSYLFLYR